ncbi:PepSY-associated TM helix domain-containing protein [Sphingomonas sp.]|uniref:PepSY-associated TM helix domain-containing protein n=1 Tax=Sphingomonas sp. TaxID=28214 RepID=UPI001EB44A92|nr:PepSY-associated TM helix domain-containing protein [Sphingomonas sp.]MBX3592972.1 PepSY domain-containing protein [Sphingomonas sp.]
MRWIDLIHRWAGGLIGLLLATLGLTGAILVFKDQWLRGLPGATDAPRQDVATLSAQAQAAFGGEAPATSILFPTDGFGLARLSTGKGAGAYADQAGQVVTRWSSKWERFELWLFDLHHYLLFGDAGKTVAGIAGLIGIGFVVTGAILWWRTRRSFRWRLVPRRMSRPAIVTHHRDLGIVFAPLLFLSMSSGMLMVLKPISGAVFAPGQGSAALTAPFAPPDRRGGALAASPDWRAMIAAAQVRFPGAEIRAIALPRKAGDLIQMRLRQPAEWLPNGRTLMWFRPEDGRVVDARDAQAMPTGVRASNAVYPIHAAKVGSWPWKIAIAATGLALTMLGSLSVWTFWFRRGPSRPGRRVASRPAARRVRAG